MDAENTALPELKRNECPKTGGDDIPKNDYVCENQVPCPQSIPYSHDRGDSRTGRLS